MQLLDVDLVPYENIRLELCDQFREGAYLHNRQQIILCANNLTQKEDFENAAKRQLIRMYDHVRSENYNFNNCKHLACTEVRAALFNSECNLTRQNVLMAKLSLSDGQGHKGDT